MLKERIFKDDPNPFVKKKTFGSREVTYYEGKVVLAYLIDVFNKTRDNKKTNFLAALIFGVAYSSIPAFIRVYGGLSFHGYTWFAIVICYLNFFLNTILMLTAFMFFLRFLADMRRRHFMLQQLGMSLTTQNLS